MPKYLVNTTFHAVKPHYDRSLAAVERLRNRALDDALFSDAHITDILVDVDPAMQSFSLMLYADDLDAAMAWVSEQLAAEMSASGMTAGEHIVWFTTPMAIR